jgi:hypothetical protein
MVVVMSSEEKIPPKGFVLVPRTPTSGMVAAGWYEADDPGIAVGCWRAMIKAWEEECKGRSGDEE